MPADELPAGSAAPLVSVVTPFYNSAEFLEDCIRSVLGQSYGHFEYILLDNCSTDGSAEIAERYARTEPRIRLSRNTAFLDQVGNFNAALKLIDARSRYTKMVLADDSLFPRCLEAMTAVAERDPSVGIVSAYRMRGDEVGNVGVPQTVEIIEGPAICRRQLLQGHHYFGSPSSVMYASDVVRSRNPFFAPGLLHEDTEACYEILRRRKFAFVHQVLTTSRIGNESVMNSVKDFEPQILDRLIILGRFGREYLSESEFAQQWRRYEDQYLRLMAQATVRGRSAAFWEYHRRGQRSFGYEFGSAALAPFIAKELLGLLRSPRLLLRTAAGWLKRATRSSAQ
jgi:glycosyltransferase involved in cell wall biosynthesis